MKKRPHDRKMERVFRRKSVIWQTRRPQAKTEEYRFWKATQQQKTEARQSSETRFVLFLRDKSVVICPPDRRRAARQAVPRAPLWPERATRDGRSTTSKTSQSRRPTGVRGREEGGPCKSGPTLDPGAPPVPTQGPPPTPRKVPEQLRQLPTFPSWLHPPSGARPAR